MSKAKNKSKPAEKPPEDRIMVCDDCGYEQPDMGKGVCCEECDGPMSPKDNQ